MSAVLAAQGTMGAMFLFYPNEGFLLGCLAHVNFSGHLPLNFFFHNLHDYPPLPGYLIFFLTCTSTLFLQEMYKYFQFCIQHFPPSLESRII